MSAGLDQVKELLATNTYNWLVTGAAGFIGSNLVEFLLSHNQKVRGLDNFATGHKANLDDVKNCVGEENWRNFTFIEGDIRDLETCKTACENVDYVLHQAALGSVPRSIKDPITSNAANINGFLNMLEAVKSTGVKRMVYASSSSVYGDSPELPKVEERIGKPLSPYAVTKAVNELYANVFSSLYNIELIGLRYFNVFGPRQDPNGAYAAVIPKWIGKLLNKEQCTIYGDGETSRDFCYILNVVQANLLAALTDNPKAINQAYNVACNEQTSLNELYQLIHDELASEHLKSLDLSVKHEGFRQGDVRHSLADIAKAKDLLAYTADFKIKAGLKDAIKWYVEKNEQVTLLN